MNAPIQDSTEEFIDDDTRATDAPVPARISRSGYGTMAVFKLTPTGVTKIKVAVQSVAEVLRQPHYSAVCPDCGFAECGPGENDCPGRPPRAYRICPVASCNKRIYDTKPTGKYLVDEFDHSGRDDGNDPNVIRDDSYNVSTPESRTKAMMDTHIVGVHPATAMEMGIRLPELQKAVSA